jgi:hypothetical protein
MFVSLCLSVCLNPLGFWFHRVEGVKRRLLAQDILRGNQLAASWKLCIAQPPQLVSSDAVL